MVMADIPEHLKSLYQKLVSLPVNAPPPPWRRTLAHTVGGLTDVASVDSSDLILVISSRGRGLFECVSGERIERDPSVDFNHDTANLVVEGIGFRQDADGRSTRRRASHGKPRWMEH
jgi:hypothetical protein